MKYLFIAIILIFCNSACNENNITLPSEHNVSQQKQLLLTDIDGSPLTSSIKVDFSYTNSGNTEIILLDNLNKTGDLQIITMPK